VESACGGGCSAVVVLFFCGVEEMIPYTADMKVGYHEPGDVYIVYEEYSDETIVGLRHVRTPDGEPWIGLGPNMTRQDLVAAGATVPETDEGTHHGCLRLVPAEPVVELVAEPVAEPVAKCEKKEVTITVDGNVKLTMTVYVTGDMDISVKDLP
jgi:hypothetical protein